MLINTVQFNLSLDGGRETVLTMVEKDSYTIAIAEPVAIANTGLGLFPGLPSID